MLVRIYLPLGTSDYLEEEEKKQLAIEKMPTQKELLKSAERHAYVPARASAKKAPFSQPFRMSSFVANFG